MNKQSVVLPGAQGAWGSYVSKYQPDSSKVLDNMFTAGSKNFVTDQTGMIQKRQGGINWNRTAFSEPAKDTYEAVFESGARHFLRVGGGVLSASTGTGLFDVITSGYSPVGNFEWATYQNRTYGCNGVNAPQTYDTATNYGGVTYTFTTGKTKVMGAQAPATAPTAGTPTSGGSIPTGSHKYKVTFTYYSAEESNGSTASSAQIATTGVQTIPLTAVPVGGYGVTARNIYRDNNDGNYLLLDTIADNTTTTYTDILSIGSTPTPMPQFNNVPPTFSKIALWNDSLFIAPTGEPNTVRFSNSGDPDIFDPGNFVTCQSDDIITALYVYNGKMYIFGLHSFGSIEGNTPDTYYYHSISTLIGCVDNRTIQVRSIVSVPTLWWLSDKGFYYSNGNTVEYGSDLIQDLVNLGLAQVNFSNNRNVQTSQADFAGDASTPGIDIASQPGSVMTINPKTEYSSAADWLGGSSLVNCKTSDGDFLEVPTQFPPTLASGTLSGDATIVGSNATLPTLAPFVGETYPLTPSGANPVLGVGNSNAKPDSFAQRFYIPRACTLTSATMRIGTDGGNGQAELTVWSDASNQPTSVLASQLVTGIVSSSLPYTGSFSVPLAAGYVWIGWRVSTVNGGTSSIRANVSTRSQSTGVWAQGFYGGWDTLTWATPPTGTFGTLAGSIVCVSTVVASSGAWISPVYDSGSASAVSANVTVSGSFPTNCSGDVTVYASTSSSMTLPVTQVVSNPNGGYALSLSNYRYWVLVSNLNSTNNENAPTLGAPLLTFSTSAEWISQPIDSTTDNTAWGSLTYTGNVPLGTSITLSVATSASQFSGYTSFGPVGSALLQRWVKVKVTLTTDVSNITSPSIASVTLTWSVTSSITSSIIDSGTIPAGFNAFQWEQLNPGVGTVTFYIKTAASSGGIPAASFVSVANGAFPNLSALQYIQWKAVLSSTADAVPEITSVTTSWLLSGGASGIRCSSVFYNKTYYVSVATLGSSVNDTLIQLDQFGNWRIQKDTSAGTFLSYFNTLYFTDGISGNIYNGFIADTDNGTAIQMDVRTKAWSADNDLFLKIPRACKITGVHTGTSIHAYYSPNRGTTWIEMLNENGTFGYQTNSSGTVFTILFVPDATTLNSGRTLVYRLTSSDIYPCSIINYVPSFYSRKGRYLNNG